MIIPLTLKRLHGDKQILSAGDKTVLLWDHTTMTEVKSLSFDVFSSMGYIPKGMPGNNVWTICCFSQCSKFGLKSFEAPATINSASLHPEKEFLVAGGEDFKLYKYDYNSGEELGKLSFFFSLKIIQVP